eukprot:m.9005 g.9005  ORF g.9005 m.9005 type:complete len:2048 (+) comp3994_c0_seq1:287-6430(+)
MSALDAIFQPKLAAEGLRPEDGVADMTAISNIDVAGVNTNLRVRFERNDIYTYTGTILVAVNPYQYLPIYEQDTMRKYNGRKMGEMPPHVFATAEAAYMNVQRSEKNQSCVISGESGAGKTETTKFILQYLCTVTSTMSNWVEQQIMECNTILEAFGNAKTVRNDNSSRFGKFMQVCFSSDIEIKGMIVQEYLLEQSRITLQSPTERNYHVFYQLLASGHKDLYRLRKADFYDYVNKSGCYTLDGVDDKGEFEKLCMALTVLSVEDEVQEGIFALVSAVLLLGNLRFKEADSGEKTFLTSEDETLMKDVADLLGIDRQQANQVVITRQIVVKGESTTIPLKLTEAQENRNAMAKALYSRTFAWLIDQINQTTNPGQDTSKFIGVLDIFGFENFEFNSFEQLCINFTNEKLHKFFNHYVFALEQAEYTKEGIDFDHIQFTDNTVCLELIEKPPMCVIKILDEECKVPKGTDVTYLEKQHAGLSEHPHYSKGTDRTMWGEQFTIKHFAGDVTYTVDGFLSKNKDADQGLLFELMRNSKREFIKDVTRFQDMLALERNMIAGKKANRREAGSNRRSQMLTNKAKPTVADTFRRQLAQLVDILDTTTPWYVRCIKPNSAKKAKMYDDELCTTQLTYSGMLDIVRIRKEGFPVHVPAEVFVNKYRAIAQVMKQKLDDDPRKAAVEILTYIKAPKTEWQLGKTKIFLRESIFEPLEEKLKTLLQDKVVLIQTTFRMWRMRKRFVQKKLAVVRIQAAVVGATVRLGFIQKRRSAIKIQAWWRGVMAREFAKALKIKRKKEMERRKKEEEERRKKELQERGDAMMEESFLQAQKELIAMAKVAESKLEDHMKNSNSNNVSLDAMFTYLADDNVATGLMDADTVANEMDRLFKDPTAESTMNRKADGKRTIRRKKRVQKKMDDQEATKAVEDESFNLADYSLIKFAEKYFNDHPKPGSGTMSRRSTRKQMPIDNPMDKADMCVYTKHANMPTSMIHMHNPDNVTLACSIFKDLHKQMKGELRQDQAIQSIQSIIAYCLERAELRDEIFCQLMRQCNNNPDPEAQLRGWHILCVCCVSFPPAIVLYRYLLTYVKIAQRDKIVGSYADWALEALKKIRANGVRRIAPSMVEIEAIRAHQPIICRFYFLDGKAKAVGVHPSWTASDVIAAVAEKIGLQNTAGWALFESTPQAEHFIRNYEYVGDILAEWEAAKRSSMQMSKYSTMSRKGPGKALGGGDAKFVFRKRLFLNPREISSDPVEYGLVYAQAVHSVVRADEFPVTEKVALQLAGYQGQVLWGEADPEKMSRYDDVTSYLPWRIMAMARTTTKDQWMDKLFEAHREYGAGKTEMQAKVLYLTAVKQYPLYGGTNFDVTYKGFWQFPNRLYICVDFEGFKLVATRNKEILAEFKYDQLRTVEVNDYEDTITLNMVPGSLGDATYYMFVTPRKDDIANLIASYSPKHRNWKQIGLAATTRKKAAEDELAEMTNEVRTSQLQLAGTGMLLKPPESKGGFLATTLRRKSSKSKMQKYEETGNLAEIYDRRYWSYSKTKMTQPLTQMSTIETQEVALKTFESLLIFAGLAREGGFLEPDDPGHILLVQNVIAKCLEKEDVCNEFYLQLIKQTTDQPDPNGRINVQNWRFLALILGVVVPRNKSLLNLIHAHLRLCSADPNTEEGKFAQFCRQCLTRTLENKNRKYPPSRQEIMCVVKRAAVYARFYFMDGEFRALMFDAAATTAEVVGMIKDRVGLPEDVKGFSLFEVFGSLERNMLPWEKVADAIYKWEKYARNTRAVKELRLTFKKRLFFGPFEIPKSQVEFDLTLYQALDAVRTDAFPITVEEGCQVAALRAQVELGDWDPSTQYDPVVEKYLPKYMRTAIDTKEIAVHHQKLKGKSQQHCNVLFLKFVMSWELYGSTVFEVLQSYTSTLPKNLWLAVNEKGIHILRRRSKDPLISYSYRNIVNYSPSLKNLMIVTESLTRGPKFVFNTSQASQIAHLIKDYTHHIIQSQGAGDDGGDKPVRSSVVDRSSVVSNNDEEEMRGFEDVDPGHDSSHVFKRKMSGEYGF